MYLTSSLKKKKKLVSEKSLSMAAGCNRSLEAIFAMVDVCVSSVKN